MTVILINFIVLNNIFIQKYTKKKIIKIVFINYCYLCNVLQTTHLIFDNVNQLEESYYVLIYRQQCR